jgi:hypothetical protein
MKRAFAAILALGGAFAGLSVFASVPAVACQLWQPETLEARIQYEMEEEKLPLIYVVGQLLDLGPKESWKYDHQELPARCGTLKILAINNKYASRLPPNAESVRICFHYDPPDFSASCSYDVSNEWIGGIWEIKALSMTDGRYWVQPFPREIIAADKLETLAQYAKAKQTDRAQATWSPFWTPEIKPAQ